LTELPDPGATTPSGFAHLHARSWYSFRRGASSPDALVKQALLNGDEAVAVTDFMSVAGGVPLQSAARGAGLHAVIGAELNLEGYPLVLLAANNAGFATINRLISRGFEHKDERVRLEDFRDDSRDVFVLTGGREGRLRHLLLANQPSSALAWVRTLEEIAPGRVLLEVSSHRREGEARMVTTLLRLARVAGLRAVASNDVRYAVPEDAARYDALILSRHRLSVHDDHPERLWSREAWLKPRKNLEAIIRTRQPFLTALEIARECRVDVLPGLVAPPRANLPAGVDPNMALEALARAGIKRRYPPARRRMALDLMERELKVIEEIGLAEFFLVVHEVVEAAWGLGIRTAGRGSAASSVVVYALGIAHADPLQFRLRFERFLNPGRFANGREAPDIDIDVQSERRDELIAWVTARFEGRTAMAANFNTYGLRGATRDAARLLGWSHEDAGRLTSNLPDHARPNAVRRYKDALEGAVGPSPLLETLQSLVEHLDDCPRDLGLHSGGMLLARDSIFDHSAVKRSANGTLQTFLDKRTAEANGVIKLDLLGLLALDVLQTTLELLEGQGITVRLEEVDLDDPRIYAGIQDGAVIGLFQIESPAQQALLAQLQPTCFLDLVAQVALIRPGPIQAMSVRPYIRRRNGLERVTYPHACLGPVLRQTYGLMVFQDQAVEAAQVVCGMSVEEADRFRKLVSKARDRQDMEGMREEFVRRALETHHDLSLETASSIFETISGFSGYGFPLAHSVAFATTAAHTAYLKTLYPAAFLAAVLEHEPGMYPRMTITEEARRLGVPVLPALLEASDADFKLERHDGVLGIRLPLSAIEGVGEAVARALVLERERAAFRDLEDFYRRAPVPVGTLEALAKAGALETFGSRRDVLWQLGMLTGKGVPRGEGVQAALFETSAISGEDLALLEGLDDRELVAWDLSATRTSLETHPMRLLRPALERAGVRATNRLHDGWRGAVAGLVIARQRPETAGGFVFLFLEDEFGHCQGIVRSALWAALREELRSRALVLEGRVQRLRGWKTMVVEGVLPIRALAVKEPEGASFARVR
jgi:error-prone DNA polymerase